MSTVRAMLHAALVKLQATPIEERDSTTGICEPVRLEVDRLTTPKDLKTPADYTMRFKASHELGALFSAWPDGTGCKGFPVPSPVPGVWEGHHYYDAAADCAMWTGTYGEKRIALLDWLVEQPKV